MNANFIGKSLRIRRSLVGLTIATLWIGLIAANGPKFTKSQVAIADGPQRPKSQVAPFSLNGISLGMSITDFKLRNPAAIAVKEQIGFITDSERFAIYGFSNSEVTFFCFHDRALYRIDSKLSFHRTLPISEEPLGKMMRQLIDKLGEPTKIVDLPNGPAFLSWDSREASWRATVRLDPHPSLSVIAKTVEKMPPAVWAVARETSKPGLEQAQTLRSNIVRGLAFNAATLAAAPELHSEITATDAAYRNLQPLVSNMITLYERLSDGDSSDQTVEGLLYLQRLYDERSAELSKALETQNRAVDGYSTPSGAR